jgi:hypothetical protein
MESVVNRQSDNAIATPSVTIRRRCACAPDDHRCNKGWWNWYDDMAEYCPLGGRSSVGRAPVCGTGGRGFEPRRSPQVAGGGRPFVPYTAAAPLWRSDAPLAQRQSNGLLIRRFWVRNPGGAPGTSGTRASARVPSRCFSAEGTNPGVQRTSYSRGEMHPKSVPTRGSRPGQRSKTRQCLAGDKSSRWA